MPSDLELPTELDAARLEPASRHDQTSLLDALSYLDDFDFDGLEVGQSAAGGSGDRRPAEATPPPVGEPPPAPPPSTPPSTATVPEEPGPDPGSPRRQREASERPEPAATPASVKSEPERGSVHMDYREGTANITDFSPEWAYTEVIGPVASDGCSLLLTGGVRLGRVRGCFVNILSILT